MHDAFWLVCTKKGASRMTKGRPTLERHERAVLIRVSIPDATFDDPPMPEVSITIPPRAVMAPEVVVEVQDEAPAAECAEVADAS